MNSNRYILTTNGDFRLISSDDELYHYGVKGMKWGVRKRRAPAVNVSPNYSSQQRTRDKKIYGAGAVKRINKRMLAGESIQSARHNEVVRKSRIAKAKNVAATAATSALVLGGAAAVTAVLQKRGLGTKIAGGLMTEEVVNIGRSIIESMFN